MTKHQKSFTFDRTGKSEDIFPRRKFELKDGFVREYKQSLELYMDNYSEDIKND